MFMCVRLLVKLLPYYFLTCCIALHRGMQSADGCGNGTAATARPKCPNHALVYLVQDVCGNRAANFEFLLCGIAIAHRQCVRKSGGATATADNQGMCSAPPIYA